MQQAEQIKEVESLEQLAKNLCKSAKRIRSATDRVITALLNAGVPIAKDKAE
jgi:hypothetical protein